MANDSDLYNRWQAAQDYATRVLVDAVKALRAGKRPEQAEGLHRRARRHARRRDLDPGYRAQFLFLPSESDIARVIGQDVDPLAIHKARKALRKAIGTMLHDTLADIYRAHEVEGALFAGAGGGRQAGAAQCGARLPDEPRPAGGHRPRRGAFRATRATPPTR